MTGSLMSAVAIKGWCPGAFRPMQSGDGLVVRIRPRGGRIDGKQVVGIADFAQRHGNGLIDLTSRANLQVRGVSEASYPALMEGLAQLGLLDSDPDTEGRRNILVSPFWEAGDEVASIADELERALAFGPADLPIKFGFAVDCGKECVLSGDSADVRIERDDAGQLMVRADGVELGRPVTRGEVVKLALGLAEWFVYSGGANRGRGRMAAYINAGAELPESLRGHGRPARSCFAPKPHVSPQGALFGVAFGQVTHATLNLIAKHASALRMTPWRMMLAEGLHEMPRFEGLITQAFDPRLRVIACSGAPRCLEAHADTRALAAALAPHLDSGVTLHVSGCAKGCAHPRSASLTLVGTSEGFDLIRDGSARDVPVRRGLSGQHLIEDPTILGSV
jgi:precorrin-3B synthase